MRWSSRAGSRAPACRWRASVSRTPPTRSRSAASSRSCAACDRCCCTRTSCTPTSTACSRAASPACRCSRARSTASTRFASRRAFAASDRTVGRLLDLHIAISAGLARYLARTEGFAESSFEVVHYGIVPGSEPEPPAETPRLAVVGRLIPIKGHDTLLRAMQIAVREVPGLELEVAGSGPLEDELRAQVSALGLDGSVRFLGQVPGAAAVLERASIVVVPSLGEGFGMVALEAMERGRAVVASDVGGLPEIVAAGETGLLVPPGDAAALAAAIVELARDPVRVRAFGAAGRRRALESFSQERCTTRTAELYEEALGRVRT